MRKVVLSLLLLLVMSNVTHAELSPDMRAAWSRYFTNINRVHRVLPNLTSMKQLEQMAINATYCARTLEQSAFNAWSRNGRRHSDWLAWRASVYVVAAWGSMVTDIFTSQRTSVTDFMFGESFTNNMRIAESLLESVGINDALGW